MRSKGIRFSLLLLKRMSIIIHSRPEWVYFWFTRSSSLAIPFQCRGFRIIGERDRVTMNMIQPDRHPYPSSRVGQYRERTRDRPGIKSCPKKRRNLGDCNETATHIAQLQADCIYRWNAIDNGNCVGKCCVEEWWMLVQQSCQNKMLVVKKWMHCLALHWEFSTGLVSGT